MTYPDEDQWENVPPPGDDDAPPETGPDNEYGADLGTGEVIEDEHAPAAASGDVPADPIGETFDQIHETISDHEARIGGLEEVFAGSPDGPWAWASLSSDQRVKLWRQLYDWVMWLEQRYIRNLSASTDGVGVFSADWYRHPVAVEMLTALMVAHKAAYSKKAAAASFVLVEWHERCLWPTLARMEKLKLFHRNSETNDWDGPELAPTRRDPDRFRRFVDADRSLNATGVPSEGV